jgi:hypothetical protein
MNLEDLCDDVLIHIQSFLNTKDSISLIKTCNRFKTLYTKSGYIKSLEYGNNKMDFETFCLLCYKGKNTIKSITMHNTNAPVQWLPLTLWPDKVVFERCFMDAVINPVKTVTETLIINDVHRCNNKQKLTINWKKFSNLKILDLYIYDIDLTGIENCKMLEAIRIDTHIDTLLPDCIAQLINLKFIAVTCKTNVSLHFLSPKLKVCFVPKTSIFTSNSVNVPKSHLIENSFVNIQCFNPIEYVECVKCY